MTFEFPSYQPLLIHGVLAAAASLFGFLFFFFFKWRDVRFKVK